MLFLERDGGEGGGKEGGRGGGGGGGGGGVVFKHHSKIKELKLNELKICYMSGTRKLFYGTIVSF